MRGILPRGSHRSGAYFSEKNHGILIFQLLSFVNKSLPTKEFPDPLPADPYTCSRAPKSSRKPPSKDDNEK